MDEVLSKRQGCQGVGSRAAAHSKTIAFALAGVGVLFFLFVLCYTTWMLSLRKNLQTANETSDELLANNGTGPFTVSIARQTIMITKCEMSHIHTKQKLVLSTYVCDCNELLF